MARTDPEHSAFVTDLDVFFGGQEVPDNDIIALAIDLDLGQPGMCTVTLRNDKHVHTNERSHAQSIEVKAGGGQEGATKAVVFKGEVVSIEPTYRAQGESRVLVRAFNKMHRMLRGRKSKTYQNMSDQDVVSAICGNYGLSATTGSTPKIKHEHLYQHNQTDLEFIRVRAARLGFQVWVDDNTLYFDAPKLDQDSGIELMIADAGEHHLKTFSARLSSAHILKKVTVRGWDPKTKKEIVGDASAAGSPLGSSNAASASGEFGQSETYTVDHPIFSVEEAKAIAKAKLGEMNMGYITAEAECRGNGAYKPGMVVKVTVNKDTASDRFNGKYLITGVTHRYTHGTGAQPTGGFASVLRLARDAEKP